MVLADTSVWVAHLRHGAIGLKALLHEGRVLCHPFIIGDFAWGALKNRSEILSLVQALIQAVPVGPEEVIQNYAAIAFKTPLRKHD